MKDNETIAKIRQIRKEISQKVDFDSKKLIDFYKERQKQRMLNTVSKPGR